MAHGSETPGPSNSAGGSQTTPWLRNVLGSVLVVAGLLGMFTALSRSSHTHTEGRQQITDVRVGLADSPLYVSHVEEPPGGAVRAIEHGQETVVLVRETRWNWLSWSFLLAMSAIAATTWGLLVLIRKPKPQLAG